MVFQSFFFLRLFWLFMVLWISESCKKKKKSCWDFDWDYVESIDQFGEKLQSTNMAYLFHLLTSLILLCMFYSSHSGTLDTSFVKFILKHFGSIENSICSSYLLFHQKAVTQMAGKWNHLPQKPTCLVSGPEWLDWLEQSTGKLT